MATIDEVLKIYSAIDPVQIAKEIVSANEQNILDLNRNQLRAGSDSDGKPVRPKYVEWYAKWKSVNKGSQAPYRTPDLLVTGDFYRTFRFDAGFKIESAGTPYSQFLEGKYGDNIYGIYDRNLQPYRDMYKKELKRRING
jgi:hypothetical protein